MRVISTVAIPPTIKAQCGPGFWDRSYRLTSRSMAARHNPGHGHMNCCADLKPTWLTQGSAKSQKSSTQMAHSIHAAASLRPGALRKRCAHFAKTCTRPTQLRHRLWRLLAEEC